MKSLAYLSSKLLLNKNDTFKKKITAFFLSVLFLQ